MRILETVFILLYLVLVLKMGVRMLRRSAGNGCYRAMGCMAVLLGAGGCFRLLPKTAGLWHGGAEIGTPAFGGWQMAAAVSVTLFYLTLYCVLKVRYRRGTNQLDLLIWFLAVWRILFCLFPQNRWIQGEAGWGWMLMRDLPVLLMGFLMTVFARLSAGKRKGDGLAGLWIPLGIGVVCSLWMLFPMAVRPFAEFVYILEMAVYLWITAQFAQTVKNRE